jgi:hypothetical protein
MAKELDPALRPFTWVSNEQLSERHDFIQIARDVTRGIVLALNLIQRSQESADNGDTPILGIQHREDMLLFARASATLLYRDADDRIEVINESVPQGSEVGHAD